MANRTYEQKEDVQLRTVTIGHKVKLLLATVSTDDTVTVGGITTLSGVYAAKQSDGSIVSATKVDNVITITEAALTDEPIVIMAIGT